jgi:hypothetical protein
MRPPNSSSAVASDTTLGLLARDAFDTIHSRGLSASNFQDVNGPAVAAMNRTEFECPGPIFRQGSPRASRFTRPGIPFSPRY